MKHSEASIFVFIACIIIGLLISLNISFNRTSRVFLNSKQYQEAYNERTQLYKDISNLKEQSDVQFFKLQKYKVNEENQFHISNEIQKELEETKFILGTTDVEGQGIKITLNDISTADANTEFLNESNDYVARIVHNTDIIQVFNDLRNAGAEAISINDQRVLGNTEVYCDGPFLKVNGIKVAAPFYISAIGNKEVLKNYMLLNENYLKFLIVRKIRVEVEEVDNVKIPAYIGEISHNYLNTKKK